MSTSPKKRGGHPSGGGKRLLLDPALEETVQSFLNGNQMLSHLTQMIEAEQVRLARRRRRLYWKRLGVAVGILLLAAAVFNFTLGISSVEGQSMFPSLREGDIAVYFQGRAEYVAGDIVVFRRGNGPDMIKRVIAVGGDVVDVDGATGKITVNGIVRDEPYVIDTGKHFDSVSYPLRVPAGYLFVLGDNRDISMDSRNAELGMVSAADVRGSVFVVLHITL